MRTPFLLFCLIFVLGPMDARSEAAQCLHVFKDYTELRRQEILSRNPPVQDSSGINSYIGETYTNGGLLRQFFNPKTNGFSKWLARLKDDKPYESMFEKGVGFFRSREGTVLAREAEVPFDMGWGAKSTDTVTIQPILTIPVANLAQLKGPGKEAKAGRQMLLDLLDLNLFGPYAAREITRRPDFTHVTAEAVHMSQSHQVGALSPSVYARQPYKVQKEYFPNSAQSIKTPAMETPLEAFYNVAHVISKTADAVVVKIPLGPRRVPMTRTEELIQQMFFITYWQMVQKAYRESDLFPDKLDSALYLMDNFVKTMETSAHQDLYLRYDRWIWESMEFRMALAHNYVAVEMHGVGWQPYRYQTIADVFSPLFPTFGLTIEKYPTGQLEIKRLFNNTEPDPYSVVGIKTEYSRGMSMEFYHQVAKDLPSTAELVAISKTPIHNRLYKGMGFEVKKEEHNPEWDGKMWTLTSTLPKFLEQTAPKEPSKEE